MEGGLGSFLLLAKGQKCHIAHMGRVKCVGLHKKASLILTHNGLEIMAAERAFNSKSQK